MKELPHKVTLYSGKDGKLRYMFNGRTVMTTNEISEMAFKLYQSHGLPSDVFIDEMEKLQKDRKILILNEEQYKTFLQKVNTLGAEV